jgi:hypothetical protein
LEIRDTRRVRERRSFNIIYTETMSVSKINNIGELREALSYAEKVNKLDDSSKVVLEMYDDRDDLVEIFPFYLEVIEFKQPDGSYLKEVRLCQVKTFLKMNW